MRKLIVLFVFVLLGSSIAFAQDAQPDIFCGDLAEEDCTFLRESATAMSDVDAASFIAQMNIVDTTATETDAYLLALTIDGAYRIDMETMPDMTAMDQAAMQDPQQMQQAVSDLLNSLDARVHVNILTPGEEPAGDAVGTRSMGFDALMVDGVGYIDVNSVNRSGEAQVMEEAWRGINLTELVNFISMQRNTMLGSNLAGGMESSLGVTGLSRQEQFRNYLEIERLAVEEGQVAEVFGEDVAVFVYIFDAAGFFSDPATQEFTRAWAQANLGENATEEEVNQVLEAQQRAFENANSRYVVYIGQDDNRVIRRELVLSNVMLSTGDADEQDLSDPVIDLYMVINYDYAEVPTIEAPADATVYTIEELQQALIDYFTAPDIIIVPLEEEVTVEVEPVAEETPVTEVDLPEDTEEEADGVEAEATEMLPADAQETPEALEVTPDLLAEDEEDVSTLEEEAETLEPEGQLSAEEEDIIDEEDATPLSSLLDDELTATPAS